MPLYLQRYGGEPLCSGLTSAARRHLNFLLSSSSRWQAKAAQGGYTHNGTTLNACGTTPRFRFSSATHTLYHAACVLRRALRRARSTAETPACLPLASSLLRLPCAACAPLRPPSTTVPLRRGQLPMHSVPGLPCFPCLLHFFSSTSCANAGHCWETAVSMGIHAHFLFLGCLLACSPFQTGKPLRSDKTFGAAGVSPAVPACPRLPALSAFTAHYLGTACLLLSARMKSGRGWRAAERLAKAARAGRLS